MSPPANHLTATEAATLIRQGDLTASELADACLARIAAREPERQAWACVSPELVRAQAAACDAAPSSGLLHGIPIGVKDVLDTQDLPTQMGSPIYSGHRPAADAAIVSLLRAAGAVILGKTVTAEFAGMAPAPTTNPLSASRTPGGSSSGSAAAVADRMVPISLGTQTGGSVLRPASYCGVVGFKPSYGRINRAGTKFAAESLDTLGWMARSVQDIALVDAALTGSDASVVPSSAGLSSSLRVGVCQTYLWDTKAQPETRSALQDAARALTAAGMAVAPVNLPDNFPHLSNVRELLNDYERARGLASEWMHHRDRISPQLSASIERGWRISHADYLAAQRYAEDRRRDFDALMNDWDVLLVPCVNGEAPEGLHYAGDPAFQALWTLLHTPALGLPTHTGPNGMPVSIQLVSARHRDAGLLVAGDAIWRTIREFAAAGQ